MISFSLVILTILAFLVYLLFRLRYDSSARTFILKSLCFLQNTPCIVLKSNPKLCKAVLDSSDTKGKGIEHFLALPGWNPIYNSESVDGELWKKLLTIFRRIMHKIDYNERLPAITKRECQRIIEENDNIDSLAVQRLTIRVFFDLLFRKEIENDDEKLFIDATNEWRKHVAQKGDSDMLLKEKMVERVLQLLKETKDFDIEDLQKQFSANKYELVSAFMQPFLISPLINFSDIFCEVGLFFKNYPKYQEKLRAQVFSGSPQPENTISLPLAIIYESLRIKHPFPILERDLTRDVTDGRVTLPKGTHVYIELDGFSQSQTFEPENWFNTEYYKENSWILFATGPRMCAGRVIAVQLLENMLIELVKGKNGDFSKLRMWENHKVSGRSNDNSFSMKEAGFQIKMLANVFGPLVVRKARKMFS